MRHGVLSWLLGLSVLVWGVVLSPPAVLASSGAEPGAGLFRLILGGDVLLDGAPGLTLAEEGAVATLAGWIEARARAHADLGFANLESPVSDRGVALAGKSWTFRATPLAAPALAMAGIDVVSLANNHALDYGREAFLDTLERLAWEGVTIVGAGPDAASAYAPRVVRRGNARVVFLAFTGVDAVPSRYRGFWGAGPESPGVALLTDRARVLAAVREARRLAGEALADVEAAAPTSGIVVVSLHWGREYARLPASADRSLARAIIDAGADLVVGHHPHVVQGVEVYRDRLILYSLGNLIFDTAETPRRTAAAVVTFTRDPVSSAWVPTDCRFEAFVMDRTRLETGPPGEAGKHALLADIAQRCEWLGTASHFDRDALVIDDLPRVSAPIWADWGPR